MRIQGRAWGSGLVWCSCVGVGKLVIMRIESVGACLLSFYIISNGRSDGMYGSDNLWPFLMAY